MITNEFKEAVESGNYVRTRIMLKDIMLVDHSMKQFDEMLSFATAKMSDLIQVHDGEEFEVDEKKWDKAYLNDQFVKVMDNFSMERLALLKKVINALFPIEAMKTSEGSHISASEKKGLSTRQKAEIGSGIIGAIALGGGIYASSVPFIVGGAAILLIDGAFVIFGKED